METTDICGTKPQQVGLWLFTKKRVFQKLRELGQVRYLAWLSGDSAETARVWKMKYLPEILT